MGRGGNASEAQRDDELFDVVDGEDRVVAQATRGVVHRDRLWHRAVHLWIVNAAGDFYLQQRSWEKDTAPGQWASAASGHLDAGEDYDAAVVREAREEIGLELPAPPARLHRQHPCADNGWEFVWVYLAEAEGPFQLHPGEVIAGRWVSPMALEAWMAREPAAFAGSFRRLWAELKGRWIATP